ncbi:MAG: hypothetical protein R3E64_13060 [Halioglobus sp.]
MKGLKLESLLVEKEADKFASAFLFPRMAFLKEFPDFTSRKNISWDKIYKLKNTLGCECKGVDLSCPLSGQNIGSTI